MACEMEPQDAHVVGGPLDGAYLPVGELHLAADGTGALDPLAGFDGHYHLALDETDIDEPFHCYVWGHIARQIANRDGA